MHYKFYNVLTKDYILGGVFYDGKVSALKLLMQEEKFGPRSGGVQIRFITNSNNIMIRYAILDAISGNFPHVGITAQIGISVLYRKLHETQWWIVDCANCDSSGCGEFEFDMSRFLYDDMPHEIMICLPILSFITKMEVGIAENCQLEISKQRERKKILVLGGLHSYGIGCTDTAMMFSNIIARKSDAIVYNVSFRCPDFLEKIQKYFSKIVEELGRIDVIILEADYIRQNKNAFSRFLPNIISEPSINYTPILLWNVKKEKLASFFFENENIRREKIYYIQTDQLFESNSDLFMYSNNFLNDSANVFLFKEISKLLNRIRRD